MAECSYITDKQKTALEAAGYAVEGPYASEAACIAVCEEGSSGSSSSSSSSGQGVVAGDCGCGFGVDPVVWMVEFSGVTDGACTSGGCSNLNGQHLLQYAGKIGGLCFWQKYLGAGAHGGDDCLAPGNTNGDYIGFITDGIYYELLIFTDNMGVTALDAFSHYPLFVPLLYPDWICGGANVLVANDGDHCTYPDLSVVITPLY